MSDLKDFIINNCDEFIVTIEDGLEPLTSLVEIEDKGRTYFLDVEVLKGSELEALKMLIEEWDLANVFPQDNLGTKH